MPLGAAKIQSSTFRTTPHSNNLMCFQTKMREIKKNDIPLSWLTKLPLIKYKGTCVVKTRAKDSIWSPDFKINAAAQGIIHITKEKKNLNKPCSVSHNPESNFFLCSYACQVCLKCCHFFLSLKCLQMCFHGCYFVKWNTSVSLIKIYSHYVKRL